MNYINQISSFIKDYNTKLKSHSVPNQPFYNLRYINYHKLNDIFIDKNSDHIFSPFMLPDNMRKDEAFKVLSYLIDSIEFNLSIDKVSLKAITVLNSLLDLEKLGFKRLEFKPYPEYIQDLFIINGKINLFKMSKHYKKYFNWYIPNIKKEEVEAIYKRCGMIFKDLEKEDYKLKNDSVKQPYSKMRLYTLKDLSNVFFKTKEELEAYMKINKLKNKEIIIIDYLGHMAGRSDVIKIISSNIPNFYSQVDSSTYAVLNRFKSINEGRNIWDIEEGNLECIYETFKENGIKLQKDIITSDIENTSDLDEKRNKKIKKINLK